MISGRLLWTFVLRVWLISRLLELLESINLTETRFEHPSISRTLSWLKTCISHASYHINGIYNFMTHNTWVICPDQIYTVASSIRPSPYSAGRPTHFHGHFGGSCSQLLWLIHGTRWVRWKLGGYAVNVLTGHLQLPRYIKQEMTAAIMYLITHPRCQNRPLNRRGPKLDNFWSKSHVSICLLWISNPQ